MTALTSSHPDTALWAPTRQMTLEQARKRSAFVKQLRILFMACAAISIGLLAGHVLQSAMQSSGSTITIEADEVVTMVNPRFSGRDSAGSAYVITADRARQREMLQGAVDLIKPVMMDAMGSVVRAPTGMYNREAGILELYDDVVIVDPAGYTFTTASARIYVSEGRVEGLSPLEGKGPLGDIRSDTYEILEDGNRAVFSGNVRTVIYPSEKQPVTDKEDIAEGASAPNSIEGEASDADGTQN